METKRGRDLHKDFKKHRGFVPACLSRQKVRGSGWMERFLAWTMIILLSCILALAYRVQQLAKDRIPNPIINVNVSTRFSKIPNELQEVTVRVRANMGKGTGVVVDKKTVLTNCHILKGCRVGDTVWLDIVDGNEIKSMIGMIRNLDQARDLALIRLAGVYEFKSIAKFSPIQGQWGGPVVAIGCPNGHFLVPTQGYFHRPTTRGDLVACLGFWGNSGGPIFDGLTNKFLGIIREMDSPARTGRYSANDVYPIYLFYSIPLETVKTYLAEHPSR